MTTHSNTFASFDPQLMTNPNIDGSSSMIDILPTPPRQYTAIPSRFYLFAALFLFYMARTCWALSLLGGECESEGHYFASYCYLYEGFRAVATVAGNVEGVNENREGYLACRILGISFLAYAAHP